MPAPQQENMRVFAVVLFIFWLATSSNEGQAGYFSTPFLTQERLARQRSTHGILNSTSWGDFNPRLSTDPPNGTEATRYLNLTGFRRTDNFAWDDLGQFKAKSLEWSRHASRSVPDYNTVDGKEETQKLLDGETGNAWDKGRGMPVWQNATGLVKGEWVRRETSTHRTWADYNFTEITPTMTWSGTHGEWSRNVTGSEGKIQLRLEDKRRYQEYTEEPAGAENGSLPTGGLIREVSAVLTIEDAGRGGSGSTFDMRVHGVHWPRQGNMVLTTTSEKFAGIFGLPHLTLDENYFRSAQSLLNLTVNEALLKMEKSAFTDQSNPWASSSAGAEDTWNPSPHCEYIIYLQVHPLSDDGILLDHGAANSDERDDRMVAMVKKIEEELRYPAGAPLKHVPELKMSAVLYSPDCAISLESRGPPQYPATQGDHLVGTKEEVWIRNVNLHVLAMSAVAFGQVYLLRSQIRESYTPSTMGRVSFWTLLIFVLADGMMFAISAALSLDSTNFYLGALVLMFNLFMGMTIGGSFWGEVYKIQESEWRPRERENTANSSTPRPSSTPAPPVPGDALPLPVTASVPPSGTNQPVIVPSDQDIDAEIARSLAAGATAVPHPAATTPGTGTGTGLAEQARVTPFSTIIGRLIIFVTFLGILTVASSSWWKPVRDAYLNTVIFLYLSFWVPQIIRNTQRNSRRAFAWQFMIGQSVLRILPVAYCYLYPHNVLLVATDWKAFCVLAGWLWVQLWVLAFQDVLGPRFGMPKGWMPEAWDYHPVLREDNLEAGGLPIGLGPSSSTPSSPSLERPRSLSLGSGEADRVVREKSAASGKGGRMRIRAIDCAICRDVLEVPVVKAGQEADPAIIGVSGVLERRKYMVTPCRHIFHSACLEGWLRFRLQCPICREELPPL